MIIHMSVLNVIFLVNFPKTQSCQEMIPIKTQNQGRVKISVHGICELRLYEKYTSVDHRRFYLHTHVIRLKIRKKYLCFVNCIVYTHLGRYYGVKKNSELFLYQFLCSITSNKQHTELWEIAIPVRLFALFP